MSSDPTIAQTLKNKLHNASAERLETFAEALLQAAEAKSVPAMKIIVDLVEPPKTTEPERPQTMTDEELDKALDRFIARKAARRDQPKTLD